MPASPIAPDRHVQGLVDEGLQVSIENGYLIVDQIPYVNANREIDRGAIICSYQIENGVPKVGDHTVWFTGSVPHAADGSSLASALVADTKAKQVAGRQVLCRLSNKPDPIGNMLENHYNKMMHYVRKLARHAHVIDPSVSASSTGSFQFKQRPSVFFYPNDAVIASGLDECQDKMRLSRVCIIGAGGTGSYLLDALAKEEIVQIDVYDDDQTERKNAYRMPGAMTSDEAHSNSVKAEWLASRYSVMRTGVRGHPVRINADNVSLLRGSDFVFIAVDHGPSRGLIARFLVEQRIAFIDAGIGVEQIPDGTALVARARVTLVTPESPEAANGLPTADDTADEVYGNIQTLELNALNAMLAVIRFKQYLGVYATEEQPAVIKYASIWNSLRSGSS